jgi:glycosyltransferase involved in cell wall biosynthesis
MIAVSPSFPALFPAMVNARSRRIPWVLWLKDILPDGAEATGLLASPALLGMMRRFELAAYRSASRIVVIADSFVENLAAKGVDLNKVTRIHDPATHGVADAPRSAQDNGEPVVLCMGNIGHTQGLEEIVRAFESEDRVGESGVRLVIAGSGMAEAEVRAAIRTDRVEMTGLLFADRLDPELERATVGAVTQRYGGADFNVPSKLMNYMACALPVVASVRSNSEVARIVERSGCGWVTDSQDPGAFARTVAEVVRNPEELARRSAAGLEFARRELTPAGQAERAEQVLLDAVGERVSA